MYYEIDKTTFAVNVYDGINPEPFWYQPQYPNGDSFDSYQEAEEWAKLAVKTHDPNYLFQVPNGKGLAGEPKPTEEEIAQHKLASTGFTIDELKSLLGL